MNVVESISYRDDTLTTCRLTCGHYVIMLGPPSIRPGMAVDCDECGRLPNPAWPPAAALCTDEQLSAVADEYVAVMLKRGFKIGPAEREAIRRAAGIQDAWRVAFTKVLKG